MEVKYSLQAHPASGVTQVTQLIQLSHTYLHKSSNEHETVYDC